MARRARQGLGCVRLVWELGQPDRGGEDKELGLGARVMPTTFSLGVEVRVARRVVRGVRGEGKNEREDHVVGTASGGAATPCRGVLCDALWLEFDYGSHAMQEAPLVLSYCR